MRSIVCLVLALASATAAADPVQAPPPLVPKAGDPFALAGTPGWPKLTWLYDAPSATDAAGKVVVHWFCGPKLKTCADDLARLIELRDTNHVYIIAYLNGGQRDAKKLDPIRESEGVGRGTVAYGPGVATLTKQLGFGQASVVVDVDGKVKALTTSGDLNELDARDATIKAAIGQIKDYVASHDGPATAKPNEKFQLTLKIQLASWLGFVNKEPPDMALTGAKEIKCAETTKVDGHTLTSVATCSGPRGIYEMQGRIHFNYDVPGHPGAGTGEDGATWKFEIK